MHDANHAIAVLRELSGLDAIDFNGGNHIELLFADTLLVHIVRISEVVLELFIDIELVDDLSADDLKQRLSANYLGNTTGAGRLALRLDGRTLCLDERFEVTLLEATSFEKKLLAFLEHATKLIEGSDEPAAATTIGSVIDMAPGDVIIRG